MSYEEFSASWWTPALKKQAFFIEMCTSRIKNGNERWLKFAQICFRYQKANWTSPRDDCQSLGFSGFTAAFIPSTPFAFTLRLNTLSPHVA